MKLVALPLMIALTTPTLAAEDPERLIALTTSGAKCIPMKMLRAVATVKDLSPNQFQFLRGVYMMTPPVFYSLPDGDAAYSAKADDYYVIGLYTKASDITCSRLPGAPEAFRSVLDAIGKGETSAGDHM